MSTYRFVHSDQKSEMRTGSFFNSLGLGVQYYRTGIYFPYRSADRRKIDYRYRI
jgi:hypothetical protein